MTIEQTTAAPLDDQLLTTREVAPLLNVSTNTLRNWRHQGSGPRYVKLGYRIVRYPMSSLRAYIADAAIGTEGKA